MAGKSSKMPIEAHTVEAHISPSRQPTRVQKKEATRQQIIAATIDVIAEGGLADLTLAKITDKAAVSRGLVNFHFDNKEHLLVETLEFMMHEYLQSWRDAIANAGPAAADRLLALVESDFRPSICNRQKAAVWFAFRGESKSRPTYVDVCTRADLEYDQSMRAILEDINAEGKYGLPIGPLTSGLQSMTEGFWLDCLMYPASFDREAALGVIKLFLSRLMPKHFGKEGIGNRE